MKRTRSSSVAASCDPAAAAKRPCIVSREQLIKRLSLEGISLRSNVRMAALLESANAHGLLALAPEPQMSILDLPPELIELILRKAMAVPGHQYLRARVLFKTASTCKELNDLIAGDPNSLLWRDVWSAVKPSQDPTTWLPCPDDYGTPQPFMQRVKLLMREGCEFCPHFKQARKIHWALGLRCCAPCFKTHTCTHRWAQQHCKLPADLVASLPTEKYYSKYAYKSQYQEYRVVKRHLGPLLQQVHGPTINSIAAYEQHCADIKRAKAEAVAKRKQQAAARKAAKLARQQQRAAKKKEKEDALAADAAAKAAAEAGGGGAAATA